MSGSRVDIPDNELAQEWPFLTRQQVCHRVGRSPVHRSLCRFNVTIIASVNNVICIYVLSACTLQRKCCQDKHKGFPVILHAFVQLEEYKDAFRIFDRSGTGSFTAEDIGWVMRSLGQNPTQQQIDAIIRDMDLDNDGVIDLAEFMVRMMALTTKVGLYDAPKRPARCRKLSGIGLFLSTSLQSESQCD